MPLGTASTGESARETASMIAAVEEDIVVTLTFNSVRAEKYAMQPGGAPSWSMVARTLHEELRVL